MKIVSLEVYYLVLKQLFGVLASDVKHETSALKQILTWYGDMGHLLTPWTGYFIEQYVTEIQSYTLNSY